MRRVARNLILTFCCSLPATIAITACSDDEGDDDDKTTASGASGNVKGATAGKGGSEGAAGSAATETCDLSGEGNGDPAKHHQAHVCPADPQAFAPAESGEIAVRPLESERDAEAR